MSVNTLPPRKPCAPGRRNRMRDRRGAATVELAVAVPLMFLITFGSIECSSMIFVAHSLKVTSYEGVRVAIRPESTNTDVLDRCNAVLAARQMSAATVTFSPPDIAAVPRGQYVTVTVTAPFEANYSIVPWLFGGGKTLAGSATMVKE